LSVLTAVIKSNTCIWSVSSVQWWRGILSNCRHARRRWTQRFRRLHKSHGWRPWKAVCTDVLHML